MCYEVEKKCYYRGVQSVILWSQRFRCFLRALKVGCRKPLLVVAPLETLPRDAKWGSQPVLLLNAVLGCYHAAYSVSSFSRDLEAKIVGYVAESVYMYDIYICEFILQIAISFSLE